MARNVLMRTLKKLRRTSGALTVLTLVGAGLLFAPEAASAQTCINDVWKAHGKNNNLTCTANDVTLSSATNINILPGNGGSCDAVTGECSCFAGQQVTFTADFQMDLTADTRYDVGFYIATDGDPNDDGALTGQCSATGSLAGNTQSGTFINLDVPPNCSGSACQTGDLCGDITGPFGGVHNPLFVRATITAQCPSTPGEQLQLPFATTWRQPGSNEVCDGTGNGTTTNDVYPGSPSKCNVGTLVLDIISITTTLTVTKTANTASVAETGGSAGYSVTVANTSGIDITLTSLTDDQYGNITTTHLADASCTGSVPAGDCEAVTTTTCVPDGNPATCEVGGVIPNGGQCSCTFTGTVPAGDFPGSFTDVVEGCATNASNPTPACATDDATVPYSDVPQPPSLTKTASASQCIVDTTYDVVVTNGSAQDTLTLATLTDDVYGNITQVQGNVISTTCGQSPGPGALPFEIAVSGTYSCSFVGRITSCNLSRTNTVSGTATDNDGKFYDPTTTPPFPPDTATVVVSVTRP